MSVIESIIDPIELESQTSLNFTNKKDKQADNNKEDRLMQMPKVLKETVRDEESKQIKKNSYELFLNKFLTSSKDEGRSNDNNNEQYYLYNAFNEAKLENDKDDKILEEIVDVEEETEKNEEIPENKQNTENESNIIQESLNLNNNQVPDIFDSSKPNDKSSIEDEPIYVMKVELDKGNFQSIKIYSYTKPEELAYEFCKQHSLDINSLNYLTEEITNLLKLGLENLTQSQRNESVIQEVDEEHQDQSSANIQMSKNNSKILPINKIQLKSKEKNKLIFSRVENFDKDEVNLQTQKPMKELANNELFNYDKLLSDCNYLTSVLQTKQNVPLSINSFSKTFSNEFKSKDTYKFDKSETKLTPIVSNISIFDKLYKLSVNKKNLEKEANSKSFYYPVSNKSYNKSTEANKINNGERLYWKGMKLKEEKEKDYKQAKLLLIGAEQLNMRKSPLLNTDRNFKLLRGRQDFCNSSEFLASYHSERQIKLDKIKNSIVFPSYSFRPTINKKSQSLGKIRKHEIINMQEIKYPSKEPIKTEFSEVDPIELKNSSYYEKSPRMQRQHDLFELSKNKEAKRVQKEKQIYSSFTFHPTILTKHYSKTQTNFNSNFNSRLKYYQNKKEENIRLISEKNQQSLVFQPSLISNNDKYLHKQVKTEPNQYSQFNVEENEKESQYQLNKDAYISNFLFARKYSYNKKQKEEYINNTFIKKANMSHSNTETNQIYDKLKDKAFSKLFKELDSDSDGLITAVNFDLKSISDDVVSILLPILNELKIENETLNEKEFLLACDQLFKMLDYYERKVILNVSSSKYKFNKQSQSPNISSLSYRNNINKERTNNQNISSYSNSYGIV